MAKVNKPINFGNPLTNLVGNCYLEKKPSDKRIVAAVIKGFASSGHGGGVAWNPVAKVNKKGKAVAWKVIFNQCPGACGYVWEIAIEDEDVAKWIVNEINQARHGSTSVRCVPVKEKKK